MVGKKGLEPPASTVSESRSNQLSYFQIKAKSRGLTAPDSSEVDQDPHSQFEITA